MRREEVEKRRETKRKAKKTKQGGREQGGKRVKKKITTMKQAQGRGEIKVERVRRWWTQRREENKRQSSRKLRNNRKWKEGEKGNTDRQTESNNEGRKEENESKNTSRPFNSVQISSRVSLPQRGGWSWMFSDPCWFFLDPQPVPFQPLLVLYSSSPLSSCATRIPERLFLFVFQIHGALSFAETSANSFQLHKVSKVVPWSCVFQAWRWPFHDPLPLSSSPFQ